MKIGILTLPLHNNYGGILQNYALQKVLTELGHEAYTIDSALRKQSFMFLTASVFKRFFLKILGRNILIRAWPTRKEKEVISQHLISFINKYIKTTDHLRRKIDARIINKYEFDAIIVGSDQVWRLQYAPNLSTYFLDFLEKNNAIKKISYAASFGTDNWELNSRQTKKLGKLLKTFNAVSVREDIAKEMCDQHFQVDAMHVIDPTMLLSDDAYTSLISNNVNRECRKGLYTYILDSNDDNNKIIESTAQKLNLMPFSVKALRKFSDPDKNSINECVVPALEDWILGFINASYVVTDSFHGTALSILFNKPFISIANSERGITRFTSLLKMFDLEDRLVFSFDKFSLDDVDEIDWDKTNRILDENRAKSFNFLIKNLL